MMRTANKNTFCFTWHDDIFLACCFLLQWLIRHCVRSIWRIKWSGCGFTGTKEPQVEKMLSFLAHDDLAELYQLVEAHPLVQEIRDYQHGDFNLRPLLRPSSGFF